MKLQSTGCFVPLLKKISFSNHEVLFQTPYSCRHWDTIISSTLTSMQGSCITVWQSRLCIKVAVYISSAIILEFLHVVAFFQTFFKNWSLYWMVYLEIGLWLSAPRLHCNVTLLSVLFVIRTPPGAPGGPEIRTRLTDKL